MRTENLLNGKPEGGFRGWRRVLPSAGLAFAVIAAAGTGLAGCDSLTGGGGAVFTEAEAAAPESAGGTIAASGTAFRTINVKFEILNGGWGLINSRGIVSKQDDSYLVSGEPDFASGYFASADFTISIIVPASEKYLNIRWKATDIWWRCTYLKAGLQLVDGNGSYTVVLDYNGRGNVATKNLSDVSVNTNDAGNDFHNALARVSGPLPADLRRITVKFEVMDGGFGLSKSVGLVSMQDDSYLEYKQKPSSWDFTITITVPADSEYLNVRWFCDDINGYTYVKAKVKAESGTITLDYNGKGKVATKNLYDVVTGTNADMEKDFYDAFNHAVSD